MGTFFSNHHLNAAIAVTLGLPSALEHWANDQVLGFFRLMWEKWKKESNTSHHHHYSTDSFETKRSSVSLPVAVGNSSTHVSSYKGSSSSSSLSLDVGQINENTKSKKRKNEPMDPK